MRQQSRFKRTVAQCLAWAMVLGGVAVLGSVVGGISFAQTAPAPGDLPFGSLKSVPVQKPDLSEYIQDEKAAIALGKAFFWDQQMGSDGQMACASCHYQAGADVRTKNTVSPATLGGSTEWFGKGPNYQLTPEDYPFHKLNDPNDPDSGVASDKHIVTGSQGVFDTAFKGPGAPGALTKGVDVCDRVADPTFTIGGINTRRVTSRNAPSAINAAYNFRNFWDGRASNIFNGVDPFGDRSPDAVIWVNSPGKTTADWKKIAIPYSSLASQATGPAGSAFEMSCGGRAFPYMGRKMLTAIPLGQQTVDPTDSVLGKLANPAAKSGGKGLNTTYTEMIKRAFKPQYWSAKEAIPLGSSAPVKLSTLSSDLIEILSPGTVHKVTIDSQRRKDVSLPTDQFTQMEANFSLFWGLSIQLYEQTLIANDSAVDKYFDGNQAALNDAAKRGMDVFMGQGRCINCHGGAETTNASVRKVSNQRLERMVMGDGGVAVYDDGFYNIGVRPSTEDPGVGGNGASDGSMPWSETARCQQQLTSCDPAVLNVAAQPVDNLPGAPLTANERIAVKGSFKVPGLRNVELTGPYFHNGGQATLRQVVDFYDRGGDFGHENKADLDVDISRIGLTENQKQDLVAFLVALTDERVRWEKAPFDHPSLCIPNGHSGSTTSVTNDAAHPGQATDDLTGRCLQAVGAAGRSTALGPLKPYLGLDPQSGGVPVSAVPGTGTGKAADPVAGTTTPPPTGPAVATGTLLATRVTAPGGAIQMGSHTWVSEHLLGLCRLDPAADGTLAPNTSTCNTAAVAPGQPAFDPATNFVYVPDLSSKSAGVWRLVFDPATETVGQPTLLPGLAGTRPSTVALGPDGKLYVGSRSSSIQRFADPASASPRLETIGTTADLTHGVTGIAFVGNDLYLAEAAAVTRLVGAPSCTGTCVAEATPMQVVVPTAMAADKAGVLYVADTPVAHGESVVRRYRTSTRAQDVLASAGNLNGSAVNFTATEGLWVDAAGNVLIGDDTSAGAVQGLGRLWKVTPPA